MELRITDGTTTIVLNPAAGQTGDATVATNGYRPTTPREEQVTTVDLTRDGGELTASAWRNIEDESALVTFTGPVETARLTIQTLETLFRQAREYQSLGIGGRVYLEMRPEPDEDWWRSEVLSGWIELGPNALTVDWINQQIQATLHLSRRYYWEGPEQELSLYTPWGMDAGTILNRTESGAGNYAEITGAEIGGTLPTPLKLRLLNGGSAAANMYTFYVAYNARSSPSTFAHILEAEDAVGPDVYADLNSSRDAYGRISWTGSAWTEGARWTLPATLLGAAAGNWFRVISVFHDQAYTDAYARFRVLYGDGTVVYQSDPVLLLRNHEVQEIGSVQLPPWLVGQADLASLELALEFYRDNTDQSVAIDFIQLTPMDGYRRLIPRGYGLKMGETLVDDGIDGYLYVETVDAEGDPAGRSGHYLADGEPIMLQPGTDARLYLLWQDAQLKHIITQFVYAEAFFRPRRLTI